MKVIMFSYMIRIEPDLPRYIPGNTAIYYSILGRMNLTI